MLASDEVVSRVHAAAFVTPLPGLPRWVSAYLVDCLISELTAMPEPRPIDMTDYVRRAFRDHWQGGTDAAEETAIAVIDRLAVAVSKELSS
jgi:hypothetical protein